MIELISFQKVPLSFKLLTSPSEECKKFLLVLTKLKGCNYCTLKKTINVELYTKLYTESSVNPPKHIKNIVKKISSFPNLDKNSLIVDIGCNEGQLLNELKMNTEFKLVGIEPLKSSVERLKQNKISYINSYFEFDSIKKIKEEYGVPDIVVCRHVIEHISNPTEFIKNISSLMADNTVLLLEFPDFDIANKYGGFMYIMEQHINYFTEKTIRELLAQEGIEIIESESYPYTGGVKCLWCKKNNDLKGQKFNPIPYEYYCTFRDSALENIKLLNRLLSKYYTSGKKIAAFGVGARGISLINNSQIGKFLDYTIDDHLDKAGKFLPTNDRVLNIFTSDILYSANKPDVCLLLPMTDKDVEKRVIKQHKEYINDGGVIIEFYPGDYRMPTAFIKVYSLDSTKSYNSYHNMEEVNNE